MDEGRLDILYRKYGPPIYTHCRRLLGNESAAEDATQEVFFRVAKHLEQAPTSIEALMWIYRIATNHCLNELRNHKRRSRPGLVPTHEPLNEANENLLADRDLARRLVERAPQHLRVPAWLHFVDGMSHDEIGKTLGLSRRTIINYLGEFQKRAAKFVARQL